PRYHRYLHSFPTRRSSDLKFVTAGTTSTIKTVIIPITTRSSINVNPPLREATARQGHGGNRRSVVGRSAKNGGRRGDEESVRGRSEEHTSELQSPYDLVCR